MSYYTKNENKKVYIYTHATEFKQIGFSSEVSLMYNWIRGFQREEHGKMRKITLTEVPQCAVCGAVRVLQETQWARQCQPSSQSL